MDMNGMRSVSITLSPTQVDEIVRAAVQGHSPSVAGLIAASLAGGDRAAEGAPSADLHSAVASLPANTSDRRLSRSLVRGLSILTCFSAEREERGIVEIARDLGMSASTTHRYALTLVELGLLERCPRTRKYRLPERFSQD
jgi:hypothetical protein